ncbi:MAG: dihydrodipicolinate synthase family protein [Sporomusaceae bacterium]|nr:dihydrodipicolinate synthase family protein [Sporomusaceae bacterium]
MTTPLFKGIIPPVPTILDGQGRLDKPGMSRMIDHLVASGGVNCLFFVGSAGEFSQMPAAMRREVAAFCVGYVDGRLPVLVGAAAPGTGETIAFASHAKEIGADGVVIVNPYYALLSEDNIYNHYRTVTEAVDIPIIVYNFPALTNQNLSVELLLRLALEFPRIVGVKDTVDTVRHTRDLINAVKPLRPDFSVLAGFDEYMLETLIMGGDGGFPSGANFAPALYGEFYRAFLANNGNRVLELQKRITYAPSIFSLEAPFYSVVKEAVRMTGVAIPTHVLPPAAPLSEAKKQIVREALLAMGVLS